MRAALALLLCLWATMSSAQHWVTAEACKVDVNTAPGQGFDPKVYAELRSNAAQILIPVGRYWQIESSDGARSYLFGTAHSNAPEILNLPDRVEADIEGARIVVLELDFVARSRQDLNKRQQTGHYFRPTRGTFDLEDYGFPEPMNAWIKSRLHALGWGREAGNILQPWALAQALLLDPCNDFAQGVYPILDDRISMLGAIAGATILPLGEETEIYRFLIQAENAGVAEAIALLYGAYLDPAGFEENAPGFWPYYLRGDLGFLAAWDRAYLSDLLGEIRADETLQKVNGYLLEHRNLKFVERLMPELDAGGVFVAVGAGHIPGETGLVRLLRQNGYLVSRVRLTGEIE